MKRLKLIRRRELPVPAWPLSLFLLLVLLAGSLTFVLRVHPFLAVSHPAATPELLVLEGWMADYNLPIIIEEFRRGPYDRIATTGIALDKGSYLQEYQSYGAVTAATLRKLGVADTDLLVGATTDTRRHRTYTAAKALKQAVDASGMKVDSLTVFSQAAHSRRTWMIFKKVFGDGVDVGIVALPDENYDNDRWWGSSAGIKTVGMELIAYVHELLLDSGRSEGE